ncbi:unnamed protein product [Allacma fusca]|uniref:CMP/dCMP-type deaminase domain-containing protein n=1 Tax=Allacma fusca TaxID=39272 RepID=A0A8J2K7C7_9HEXA|nr:unnamed protein product [Allacma fusca]
MNIPDPNFMDVAFSLAEEALKCGEVPVGCVVVYEKEIIGGGRNYVNETKNATRHAELLAIDAVRRWCDLKDLNCLEIFSKIHLYVTVEPCIMCASALEQLKIPLIVYGCDNDRFGGCNSVLNVFNLKGAFQPTIISGLRAAESISLLKQFYQGENPNAPVPKLKREPELKPNVP